MSSFTRKSRLAAIAAPFATAALVLTAAVPAVQAAQQEGLVNVSLDRVAQNLAQDLDVNVSQIPATVQVPVGVAANVCGVDANVLAQQKKGGSAECEAENSSTALSQVVQRQIGQSQ